MASVLRRGARLVIASHNEGKVKEIAALLEPLGIECLSAGKLDLPGVALASAGLFGIVWGLVRGNAEGWASTEIVASLAVGALLGGRRTTEGKPTNDPESKHAADLRATTLVC